MKKNLLALLLCLSILAGLAVMPASANSDIVYDNNLEMAVDVLGKLGIASYDAESSGGIEKAVSRADFAEMLAKAFKFSYSGSNVYFSDVKSDHWAYTYINALYENNIISMADNNMFMPEEPITFAQACKMAACALGYKNYADANGGFPTGYMYTAEKTGLSYGVDAGGLFTIEKAILMTFNTLRTGYYSIDGVLQFGGFEQFTYDVSWKTPFSVIYDIYLQRGRLTSYYGGSMDGLKLDSGNVIIGDKKFTLASDIDPRPYFTNVVDFLYEQPDENKPGNVLYIRNNSEKNIGMALNSTQVTFNEKEYVLKYKLDESSNSSSKLEIERNAAVVYNGMPYTGKLSVIFNEFKDGSHRGYIYVNGTTDSKYDIVVIESYRPFVVAYNDSNGVIFNKYKNDDKIETEELKALNFYDKNNNLITRSITAEDVYMVATSRDGEIASFIYIKPEVSGLVDSFNKPDYILSLDGTEYYADKTYIKKEDWPVVGTYATYSVDMFGYIIAHLIGEDVVPLAPGYVIKACFDDSGLDLEIMFKMLAKDGTVGMLGLADRVIIDGVSYRKSALNKDKLIQVLPKTSLSSGALYMEPQVVRYSLNADGDINRIDTTIVGPEEEQKKTLSEHYDSGASTVLYKPVSNSGKTYYRFGTNVLVPTDALIFSVPNTNKNGELLTYSRSVAGVNIQYSGVSSVVDTAPSLALDMNGNTIEAEDSMYKVGKDSYTTDFRYPVQAYKYTNSGFVDVLVFKRDAAKYDNQTILIEKFVDVLDENGEQKVAMYGRRLGISTKYILREKAIASGFKEGDIAVVGMDTQNQIFEMKKMYDITSYSFVKSTNDKPEWRYDSNYDGLWQITSGKVLTKNNGVIEVDWCAPDTEAGCDGIVDETIHVGSLPVIIYDASEKEGKRLKEGTIADIMDEETVGEMFADTILTALYHTRHDVIYVIRK